MFGLTERWPMIVFHQMHTATSPYHFSFVLFFSILCSSFYFATSNCRNHSMLGVLGRLFMHDLRVFCRFAFGFGEERALVTRRSLTEPGNQARKRFVLNPRPELEAQSPHIGEMHPTTMHIVHLPNKLVAFIENKRIATSPAM